MSATASAPISPPARAASTNRWLVLVIACLAQFMVVLDATVVNVALPSILPIRTAPTGIGNGMSDTISAADAPFIARMSYGLTWSTEIGIATSWVS